VVPSDGSANIALTQPPTHLRVEHLESPLLGLARHPSTSAEVSRKILCENAAGLYGFDLASLASDVERVGLDIDGVSAPDRR
jgi:hypothetical protein